MWTARGLAWNEFGAGHGLVGDWYLPLKCSVTPVSGTSIVPPRGIVPCPSTKISVTIASSIDLSAYSNEVDSPMLMETLASP